MSRVLTLLALMLTCCTPTPAGELTDDGGKVADQAGVPVSKIRYFPPSSEQPRIVCDYGRGSRSEPIIDEFENRWFSQQLSAADEPSLYLASQRSAQDRTFILRFTWLRSFHAPVFIRVEDMGDEKYRLIAKELSGAGGYDPGTTKRKVERELRPEEVERIRLLGRTLLPSLKPKDCTMGCDGASWILEIVDKQGYRVLTRWSPESGPVREAGIFLMELSGWTFTEIY